MHRIYFPSSIGQRKLGVDTTCKYLFQLFGNIIIKGGIVGHNNQRRGCRA